MASTFVEAKRGGCFETDWIATVWKGADSVDAGSVGRGLGEAGLAAAVARGSGCKDMASRDASDASEAKYSEKEGSRII